MVLKKAVPWLVGAAVGTGAGYVVKPNPAINLNQLKRIINIAPFGAPVPHGWVKIITLNCPDCPDCGLEVMLSNETIKVTVE